MPFKFAKCAHFVNTLNLTNVSNARLANAELLLSEFLPRLIEPLLVSPRSNCVYKVRALNVVGANLCSWGSML